MSRIALMSLALLLPVTAVHAGDAAEKNIYQGSLEDRVDALASVQPGLGVIMHEIGYRFSGMYWAANGGNWGLAQYELKELREALEVGMTTRPKRAELLKTYDENHLKLIDKAIADKDISHFNQRFTESVRGCNACHTAVGVGFVRYRLPEKSNQEFLDFTFKSEPEYREEQEPRQ